MLLGIEQIRTDGGTQTRAALNDAAVAEYAEAMSGGASFPPLVVFYDGSAHWLADGFHRLAAYRKIGAQAVPVDVRQATRRDAILFSVGANATHGLPRTNADKRRAVETLLRDEEWARKSDRWIAERACVDGKTVAKARSDLNCGSSAVAPPPVREGKDGKARRAPDSTLATLPVGAPASRKEAARIAEAERAITSGGASLRAHADVVASARAQVVAVPTMAAPREPEAPRFSSSAARDTARVAIHNVESAARSLRGPDKALFLQQLAAVLRTLTEAA